MDKANHLKKNYMGIIQYLKTNFDIVPPVSFGEEWSCVEKINAFVHLNIVFLWKRLWLFIVVNNNKKLSFRLSHDVVACDVDRDVSTAYC